MDQSKRIQARTWWFEWNLLAATFNPTSQNIASFFRARLVAAQQLRNIRSIKILSFSCEHCDDEDLMIISGFLHCKEQVRDVAIQSWIQDDDNCAAPFPNKGPNKIRWTPCPLGPGQTWRDQDAINLKKFLSDDTRVREEWAPVASTAPVNRGGRP